MVFNFGMISRFYEIKLLSIYPKKIPSQLVVLSERFKSLKSVQSVTMKAQESSVSLLDLRYLFDALVQEFFSEVKYLSTDSQIGKSTKF